MLRMNLPFRAFHITILSWSAAHKKLPSISVKKRKFISFLTRSFNRFGCLQLLANNWEKWLSLLNFEKLSWVKRAVLQTLSKMNSIYTKAVEGPGTLIKWHISSWKLRHQMQIYDIYPIRKFWESASSTKYTQFLGCCLHNPTKVTTAEDMELDEIWCLYWAMMLKENCELVKFQIGIMNELLLFYLE